MADTTPVVTVDDLARRYGSRTIGLAVDELVERYDRDVPGAGSTTLASEVSSMMAHLEQALRWHQSHTAVPTVAPDALLDQVCEETPDATRAEQSAYRNVASELRTVLDEAGFEDRGERAGLVPP